MSVAATPPPPGSTSNLPPPDIFLEHLLQAFYGVDAPAHQQETQAGFMRWLVLLLVCPFVRLSSETLRGGGGLSCRPIEPCYISTQTQTSIVWKCCLIRTTFLLELHVSQLKDARDGAVNSYKIDLLDASSSSNAKAILSHIALSHHHHHHHHLSICNNNNNNNQYIYKQRQSHAMSQRRWLATAVIFHPSDMSLGFAET